ncbi:MAG: RsmD family RNA methyltransferase, partial [Acidimicrobiales bacterium]
RVMRVLSGAAGARRLQTPSGRQLRPTSERVREAVFSSLWSLGALEGARVLDLYAGSGAMGIEALSRGASSATFVEADPVAARTIEANLAATGLDGPTTRVVQVDVARFLDDPGGWFDLAFADPPYAFADWPSVLGRLPADLGVIESRRQVDPGPGWMTTRSARYGGTVVTTVQRTETDQNGGAPR